MKILERYQNKNFRREPKILVGKQIFWKETQTKILEGNQNENCKRKPKILEGKQNKILEGNKKIGKAILTPLFCLNSVCKNKLRSADYSILRIKSKSFKFMLSQHLHYSDYSRKYLKKQYVSADNVLVW